MGQKGIIATGVALLIAALVLLVADRGADAEHRAGPVPADSKIGPPRKSLRNPDRHPTSNQASKTLRRLLESPFEKSIRFEEVEALCHKLSPADLEMLLGELGTGDPEGMIGWVRSALVAEWARRDPRAAMAWVEFHQGSAHGQPYAKEQAWFALFRGWSEVDPATARDAFAQIESPVGGNLASEHPVLQGLGNPQWSSYAHAVIFKNFAQRDHAAAWATLPAGDPPNPNAMRGFFRGVDHRLLGGYAAEWSQRWSSEKAHERHEVYSGQMSSSLSGFIPVPPEEGISKEVALALARTHLTAAPSGNLTAARKFIDEEGPGNEQERRNRTAALLEAWARESPQAALAALKAPGYQDWQTTFARGIIAADPELAVEVMDKIESHGARARALLTGLSPLGSNHVREFFPVPGERNRLPDFERRYEAMLDAVEAGRFNEGQEKILIRNIHREFQHKIPAAKEAYERMTKK